MERKKMAHAIGLIAWGYLFLYFNLNLGSLNLIPNWVGYLMMGKAIKELKEASPAMDLLGPLCILLAALEMWFWTLTLIGINSQHYLLQLLSLLLAVAALYFHFQLLTNLVEALGRAGETWRKELLNLRTVRTVLAAVMALPVLWKEHFAVTVILAIAGVLVGISISAVLFWIRNALFKLLCPAEEKE